MKYRYFVRAKSYTEEGVTYVTGGVSKGRTQYFVKRTGKVKVSKKKGTITWLPTKDADGYQLYVADNKALVNGKKFTVGNVTSISLDKIQVPAGTYYISLRQYITVGKKRYVSAYHGLRKYVVK